MSQTSLPIFRSSTGIDDNIDDIWEDGHSAITDVKGFSQFSSADCKINDLMTDERKAVFHADVEAELTEGRILQF